MIKLTNILKEQEEQEQMSAFDRYNIQAPTSQPERDVPQSNKNEPKADPVKPLTRPGQQPGTKITDADFTIFKNKLAKELGITLRPELNRFFDAWRKSENGPTDYNPFATSWPGIGKDTWSLDPGMKIFNWSKEYPFPSMVKKYSTLDLGVDATAKTLKQAYFKNLLAAIKDDTKTAEDILQTDMVFDEIKQWGTNPETIDGVLKRIPKPEERETFVDPGDPNELKSINTLTPEEADAHFWTIITTWAEAEYQFWQNKGTGPKGVNNPETHDKMFDQFNDFWGGDDEQLAQRQYRNTRKPALADLLKQLNKYQDIQDLVKEYGSINLIFQAKSDNREERYRVPRQIPPDVKNRVTWYLAVFNWISYIASTITDNFQDNCTLALEWADGGDFFRRTVQAEIDPIGGGIIPALSTPAVRLATALA